MPPRGDHCIGQGCSPSAQGNSFLATLGGDMASFQDAATANHLPHHTSSRATGTADVDNAKALKEGAAKSTSIGASRRSRTGPALTLNHPPAARISELKGEEGDDGRSVIQSSGADAFTYKMTETSPRPDPPLGIPTGFCHSAQGCKERATLGCPAADALTLKGLYRFPALGTSNGGDATLSGWRSFSTEYPM